MNAIPDIKPGESLASYIYRLARANFYASMESLLSEWKMRVRELEKNVFADSVIEIIKDITGIGKDRLRKMSNQYFSNQFGDIFYNKFVIRNQHKYCPECFQQHAYHKINWMLEPVTICLDHEQLLLDACQGCQRRLTLGGLMTGACEWCGFCHYEASGNKVSDPYLLESQKIIQNELLNNEFICRGALKGLNLIEFLKLARSCSYFLQGNLSFIGKPIVIEPFYKKNVTLNNEMSCYKYGNVYWIFVDFPKNIKMVKKKFDQLPNRYKHAKMQMAKKISSNSKCEILLRKVQNFMDKPTKARVRHAKKMVPVLKKQRKQRQACAANDNVVLTNDVADQDCITRDEASSILGIIGKEQMNRIIDSGFLILRRYPKARWFLSKNEVVNFLEKYSGEIKSIDNGITFYSALKKYSQCGLSMVRLLIFIRESKLEPFRIKKGGNFTDVIFQSCELERCMNDLYKFQYERKGYTKSELLKLLRMDFSTIDALEERGVIKASFEKSKLGNRKIKMYDKKTIEDFQKRYIDLKQAASMFKVTILHLRKLIWSGVLHEALPGITKKYIVDVNETRALLVSS
ncbi:TniQ family protein [Paenibacillus chondroitinus]|uniref:TniQ family protein n=1 Tax=Paenibacillus chondroitinus TaxID=59842 RepID=A0ABU6DHI8_9BACL|nr:MULTISPECIES: TniQ family protein [Paenibacillus]MCY9658497.1 TniQ family protein [Paenibacillus anseongense]MEB4797209.1 TniQ family protein [Paenibacillus chondroitinus]